MDIGDNGFGICGSAGTSVAFFSVDTSTKECVNVVHTHTLERGGLNDVAIRKDGKIAITAGWDHRIRIFSLVAKPHPRPLAVLKYHTQSVSCVDCFKFDDSNQSMFVTSAYDGHLALWNIF